MALAKLTSTYTPTTVWDRIKITMLHYLLWRVMVGLRHSITLSFLVVGHTKFSPDWCFGLLKQRFRCTKVGCLDDIVGVVNTSAKVNVAQLVGTQEGENLVPTYNWMGMFAGNLRKLTNLKAQRHFRFDATTPDVVYTKLASDATEESVDLLINHQPRLGTIAEHFAPTRSPEWSLPRETTVSPRYHLGVLSGGSDGSSMPKANERTSSPSYF